MSLAKFSNRPRAVDQAGAYLGGAQQQQVQYLHGQRDRHAHLEALPSHQQLPKQLEIVNKLFRIKLRMLKQKIQSQSNNLEITFNEYSIHIQCTSTWWCYDMGGALQSDSD